MVLKEVKAERQKLKGKSKKVKAKRLKLKGMPLVIARHEAIADFANQASIVRDCFVPRNDSVENLSTLNFPLPKGFHATQNLQPEPGK